MWILQTADESGKKPRTFRVPPGAVKTFGRAPRADFIVNTVMVSRLHCRVSAARDHLEVTDLDSTNGTFVNGRRVDRGVLAPGDRLKIGRIELTVTRI